MENGFNSFEMACSNNHSKNPKQTPRVRASPCRAGTWHEECVQGLETFSAGIFSVEKVWSSNERHLGLRLLGGTWMTPSHWNVHPGNLESRNGTCKSPNWKGASFFEAIFGCQVLLRYFCRPDSMLLPGEILSKSWSWICQSYYQWSTAKMVATENRILCERIFQFPLWLASLFFHFLYVSIWDAVPATHPPNSDGTHRLVHGQDFSQWRAVSSGFRCLAE